MTTRPIAIKCNLCGHGHVPCRKSLFERNGEKMERLQWVCPRCGRVVKQAIQDAK
jgi:endogenous inhibitor of DNA gyrase (YacG/DUF329 family)